MNLWFRALIVVDMTLRKVMRWAILCISIALLGFAVWVGWRYLETKSMACECDDPVDGQRFAILNPFRDRAPERAAIEVIKAFQSRRCQTVPSTQHFCEEEGRFAVVSWKLTGRSTAGESITMRFWVERTAGDGGRFGDPVWGRVRQEGPLWKVDNVDLYY